ncbi:Lrp/AsnC family transcriptional regulator [Palleronia caenipelagi]|uniref:siroheme decarboxylase n=2 Tax=Palleronia caenipelagi TaxID=2489174 RepID=A0A547QAB6_9RHOB|nr:Lrp/AsnC family transcriptional regulator [Palleronia caenipelagi]
MAPTSCEIDTRLLNEFQRDAPVVSNPFAEIGARLGITEDDVLTRLGALRERGAVTRFGATCRPNTAGASTLAALAAPDWDVERVAEMINAYPGVNHSYLREHEWNLWFVVTGPDRAHVNKVLAEIGEETGLRVLDLRLVQAFNIDLGFDLSGAKAVAPRAPRPVPSRSPDPNERRVLQTLSTGLPLVPRPFAEVASAIGIAEAEALEITRRMVAEGFVTRFGVIVRHRALGWRANAMVVWEIPPEEVSQFGPELARLPGVTLCYQRQSVPGAWPYTLFNMIHGRSREDAMEVLDAARALPGLGAYRHEVLFSSRCFRQTGALIHAGQGGAV